MHGAGNDFMVVRWPKGVDLPDGKIVRGWSDRRRGVGFDQLLILEEAEQTGLAAFYRIFNSDGSEVEQCGNGVRCIARYLAGDVEGTTMILGSPVGAVEVRLLSGGEVTVNLGEPLYAPEALPFQANTESDRYLLEINNETVEFGVVSMGNPHAVIQVNSVETAPVGILGPALRGHSAQVRLRVVERGVGETRACGTGAAAAVAVGRLWGLLGDCVQVELTGGTLQVQWLGPGHSLWLSGPATRVFEGQIEL